jgi:four helix bundle protein
MSNYRDLVVWQKAFQLVKDVYVITATFPAEEKYGLVSQMRRAAVSLPSNIAEGRSRRTVGAFSQFPSHAEGSAAELETQLLLAADLGFCRADGATKALQSLEEIRKMLGAFCRKLIAKG